MVAKDEELLNNIFLVEIPPLVEGEDFEVITTFVAETNEIDLRILFFVDTEELEATVSIKDPSVFEDFQPEIEADQFNIQTLTQFRNENISQRAVSLAVENSFKNNANRLAQAEDEDAPVLEQFQETMMVEGRKFPSESKRDFYNSMGVIVKILVAAGLIIGGVFGLLTLGLTSVSNYEFFILGLLFRFVTKLAFVNVNFGNLLSIFMDQLFRTEMTTMYDIKNEAGIRSSMEGKFEEYYVPLLFINTMIIQACCYFISFILNYTSLYIRKIKIFEYIHLLVVSCTWIDILLFTMINIFNHTLSNGGVIYWIISLILLIMLIVDVSHFFVVNIFNKQIGSTEELPLRRSKSKIQEKMELNHPFKDVSEIFLNKETLKKLPLINFVNVGLTIRLLFFTFLISVLQNSPRTMTWLMLALQGITFFALLFFQTRYKVFASTFILVFRLIEEFCLTGITLLLVVFANDPDNLRFKSKTTELFQLLTMIAVMILIITEFIIYCRYILKPQKEEQKKREEAYAEVKRINSKKAFEKNGIKNYKVAEADEFAENEKADSVAMNKLELSKSRKLNKKKNGSSGIIGGKKQGDSPSASRKNYDDDKSYKLSAEDNEQQPQGTKLYKRRSSLGSAQLNKNIDIDRSSYKVEDDPIESVSNNIYKFKTKTSSDKKL